MQALVETLKLELQDARAREAQLTTTVMQREVEEAANTLKIRELEAAKSQALVTFLSRHATESGLRNEADQCKTGISAAWQRISDLQTTIADVRREISDHKSEEATAAARREEHRSKAARVEQRALAPATALQSEISDLVARLRAEDDARHLREMEAVESARAAAEAVEAARLAEVQRAADEAAEAQAQVEARARAVAKAAAAEVEAAAQAQAQAAAQAELAVAARAAAVGEAEAEKARRLAAAILRLVTSRRSTSTSLLWLHLHGLSSEEVGTIDGERVEKALEELRSSFLVYEPQPGVFGAL